MGRKRQASKGKRIRPHFWVFCEGKTEETYVCFLRSKYRLPIEIVPKIAGHSIDEKFIRNYKKGRPIHPKDIDFLMYDADIPEILAKLKRIKNTTLLASNPSIELWFLLHYKNQVAHISTDECIRELNNRNNNSYHKGVIDKKLGKKLDEKFLDASKRAKKLSVHNNPSSDLDNLVEILESFSNNEH